MKCLLVFMVLCLLAGCTSEPVPAPSPPAATATRDASVEPKAAVVPAATPHAFPGVVAFTPPAPTPYVEPTAKPPELLLQERAALLARIDQFLNRTGYSAQLQLPDLRQSPTDCEVRRDAMLHPRSAAEVPILLLSLDGGGPHCTGLFIFHWDGRAWQRQQFESGEGWGDPAAVAAAQHSNGRQVELGLAWNPCVHCSVNFVWYALLRLVDGKWVTLWRSTPDQSWRGAHGTFAFEDGLNRFRIEYSDWSPPDKKLRPDGTAIFGAANGGPHRFFVDTWQRSGDAYRVLRTVSLPGTYKTAVEFVYALMRHDDAAAAAWTTHASLVRRARELKLDRLPNPAWADPDDQSGTLTIRRNEAPDQPIAKMEPYVILRMTKPNREWLIASIERLP